MATLYWLHCNKIPTSEILNVFMVIRDKTHNLESTIINIIKLDLNKIKKKSKNSITNIINIPMKYIADPNSCRNMIRTRAIPGTRV